MISTDLTRLLGIRHPVLLAPMDGTAGGELAAAVSDGGGLGMIGGGYADPDWLRREIALAGEARVGIGFIAFALDERPDTLQLALDADPVAIQLSFGDPRPHARRIKDHGTLLICQVQSDEEIDRALEAGADVLIAQGQDGGGHGRGQRATMGLVPSMVDRVAPLPVAAAGGIADGRGLAAAITLGAGGVSLGTRFLASPEAISTPAEAAAILEGRSIDTVRTSAVDVIRGPRWPDGLDGRILRNRLTESWNGTDDDEATRRLYAESEPDDRTIRETWAGEGLDLITSLEPAAAMVEAIAAEAARALGFAHATLTDR
ncbi:MAG: nitronate monooxygenase [Aquihabitans sp.]